MRKIILGILKVLAVLVLVLLIIGTALYFFGSFKMFEPKELILSDGKKIEFTVQDNWCALLPTSIGLKNMPLNAVFIKRGSCDIKDISKPIKLSHLIQIKGNLLNEALAEQQVIGMCAQNANGLSGYQKDGAIYCVAQEQPDGRRGVTAFKKIGENYIVTTSYILLPELERVLQLKELETLVNSYKVKE